ncbi:hypothetical protein BJ138DRAFT_1015818 [Hygrophoropsis aurantiaca]|uniref:Uncharacterized protein n=1 Tax=Hygrophoropsis aurantiaca TaxID=72124 RepID=A0ACB8A030_9AGAM|nr:hypothetical protein BJ138DRAFT_1015818 [Hygrophoropsis aurantiaca]
MSVLPDSTSLSSASPLETLPNELLLEIISLVVLSSNKRASVTPPFSRLEVSIGASNAVTKLLEPSDGIHALSVTSRRLHTLFNTVLYRSVVLGDEKAVLLFGRTVKSAHEQANSPSEPRKPAKSQTPGRTITPEFLRKAIKRLAITFAPTSTMNVAFGITRFQSLTKVAISDIAKIISACDGVRTIAIGSHWARSLREIDGDEGDSGPRPHELILSSYADIDFGQTRPVAPVIEQWRPSAPSTPVHSLPSTPVQTRPSSPVPIAADDQPDATKIPSQILAHVTHLRIAEPASSWHSPLPLLRLFPALAHVALPRRANANEDNDLVFLEGVKTMLQHKRIRMVVVVVFPQIGYYPDQSSSDESDDGEDGIIDAVFSVKKSSIWKAVEELRRSDKRVYVMQGRYDMWKNEWKGPEVVASARGPGDWWGTTRRSAN